MITLYKHNISASIKDRYAVTTYLFDFDNEQINAKELKFEITIDPDAFISQFEANIDGEIFIGQTKEKQIAATEYSEAKKKNENAILITQPHKDIPNIFEIKTNIDSGSKISLTITIEQYLRQKFDFNELCIQILRNWECYNIKPKYQQIGFIFNVYDECGIYDISIPSSNVIKIDKQTTDKTGNNCNIYGKLQTLDLSHNEDSELGEIWRHDLKIGDKLEVRDLRKWYESKIIGINENEIKVHFIGYDTKYDEKINIKSDRLSPLGTHTNNESFINEIRLKYKIKGESEDSYILFDTESNTFCHIISNVFTDLLDDDDDQKANEGGTGGDNIIIPRRVIFVIDRSGSMGGSKWIKTVSATINAVKQLRKQFDRFNVILFNEYIDLLFDSGMVLSNEQNIQTTLNYMTSNEANGGTNIDKPLTRAVEMIKDDIQLLLQADKEQNPHNLFMNQIIFITDGEVSNTKQILIKINKLNNLNGIDKYNKKISIFTFGVGQDSNNSGWIKDVNHSFLKSLAVNNNGFYKRIKEKNTDSELSEYFSILSNPTAINIKIKYNNKNVRDLTNTKFNSLYSGNDIIIAGKMENISNLSVTIFATTGKHVTSNNSLIKPMDISKQITVNFEMNQKTNPNTERIWAYLKLQQLTKQKLIHHNDMIEMDDDEEKEEQSLGLELTRVSLEYGI